MLELRVACRIYNWCFGWLGALSFFDGELKVLHLGVIRSTYVSEPNAPPSLIN